jgi:spore coat polysaccharide biosynthesis protein SpsF
MYTSRNERIIATIEARMTSSRLPGKVLLPLAGKPALQMQIERLKQSRYLDGICVATTTNASDDSVVALAGVLDVECYRGSEADVMGRVLGAARSARADIIVEMTGDCPFNDPALVDRGIEEFFSHDVDYASNTIHATYPNGFDVQVFSTATLADAAARTVEIIDRTHVSYYIYTHPGRYRCYNWEANEEERWPELRVTLDEKDDYAMLSAVAEAFKSRMDFTAGDSIRYLRAHPEVAALNARVRQKEPHEL